MARLTRVQKQAETRALLVEAAAKEFAEQGYAGARVESIAEAAGFSKGAFYSNFRSKEELALALLRQMMAARKDRLTRVLATLDGGKAALTSAIQAAVVARQKDRLMSMLRLELLLQAARNATLRTATVAHYREARTSSARQVAEICKRLGHKPPADPHAISDTFMAVNLGSLLLAMGGVKLSPIQTIVTMLLNTLLFGHPPAPARRGAGGAKRKTGSRPRAAE